MRALTPAPDEFFIVDDGSTDDSVAVAKALGVRVLEQTENRGRGHTRNRAMLHARGDLVLCLDATNRFPPDFLTHALPWFERPKVAAVFGRISEDQRTTLVQRWRGRHLFKDHQPIARARQLSLSTYGTVVRREAVLAVGGFDPRLRHSEDRELGDRLNDGGHRIICDPELRVFSHASNTILELLERYWRWHAGQNEELSVKSYLRHTWYCWTTMLGQDLKQRDYQAACVTIGLPAYILVKNVIRRVKGTRQKIQHPGSGA